MDAAIVAGLPHADIAFRIDADGLRTIRAMKAQDVWGQLMTVRPTASQHPACMRRIYSLVVSGADRLNQGYSWRCRNGWSLL